MAASCRRLGSVARRTWSSSFDRAGPTQLRCHLSSSKASRLAACAVTPSVCLHHRLLATKAIDSVEPVNTEPGFFGRFWRWLNDEGDQEVMGETERREREEMLQRVQTLYFAKPPVIPGLDFYKDAFEMLMKHDDGLGVETLWNFMREMNVKPDAELEAKVKPYLAKVRQNVWFE